MSTINGAGALTTKAFHRYFFRVNTSGPMGARAISLYLAESPMKRFYALGSDYAWGRDSVASFSAQIQGAKKDIVGTDYPPVGTKDFASYIAKIRQSKAEGVYIALPGQDATIYLKQAHQFGLNREVKPIMEIVELENMKAVGEAMVGTIGSSRYPFTVESAKNKEFVRRFHDLHGLYPDMFDGETYEGLEWLAQVIQKAGTADDLDKIIEAWEDSKYDGLEGPFFMRKCDHQAVQPGFAVQAVKDPKYPHLIPKILATYPGDKVTPKCRTEEFS
jgi:branched-chain amino acid transport system substrate-binding protein